MSMRNFGWTGIATLIGLAATTLAADLGTAFTYQGFLEKPAGTPVTDTCDFRFGLWDAAAGGNQKGNSPQTKAGVSVTAGVFTVVDLNFGASAIDGTARWLEIEVQCGVIPTFFLLAPRVELKPAPHALALPGLYTQQNATSPNLIGGHSTNVMTAGVGGTIGGGGAAFAPNRVTNIYGTVGGGLNNTAGGSHATVGGGTSNMAGGSQSTVGGGASNIASGIEGTIGGGSNNIASGATWATVPGGTFNQAGGRASFAAGLRAKVRNAAQSLDADGDEGTFIWADFTDADFTSTGPNQFLIRAGGGVGINRGNVVPLVNALEVEGNASKTAAGDWLANSDARIKTGVQTVSQALETLDKVRLVEFRYTEEYRAAHPTIADRPYLNIIAQEFDEIFPDYVNAGGDTMSDGSKILQADTYPLTIYSAAAVQELHRMVKEKDCEIEELRNQKEQEITELREKLARLEVVVGTLAAKTTGGGR